VATASGLEHALAQVSEHIQKVTFAYGSVRTPRVQLRASTNDEQALMAAVRVARLMLKQDPAPAELIGQRSGYSLVYVDLPPEAEGPRQSTRPFALRGLDVSGTVIEDHGARRVFGAPFILKANVVYEQNGSAVCCKSQRVGEIRGHDVVLD
jgi:hypothetical protein